MRTDLNLVRPLFGRGSSEAAKGLYSQQAGALLAQKGVQVRDHKFLGSFAQRTGKLPQKGDQMIQLRTMRKTTDSPRPYPKFPHGARQVWRKRLIRKEFPILRIAYVMQSGGFLRVLVVGDVLSFERMSGTDTAGIANDDARPGREHAPNGPGAGPAERRRTCAAGPGQAMVTLGRRAAPG